MHRINIKYVVYYKKTYFTANFTTEMPLKKNQDYKIAMPF